MLRFGDNRSMEGIFLDDALCLMVIDYEIQKTDQYVYGAADEVEANQMHAKSERMKKGLQDVLLARGFFESSERSLSELFNGYTCFLAEVDEFLYEGR